MSHYFFFLFSVHLQEKEAKSCAHLHKHKYLLLWFLIAVIKEGIEWIRCLLHNYKALKRVLTWYHNMPQEQRMMFKANSIFTLTCPPFLFNASLLQSHKVINFILGRESTAIQGHAVQKASNNKEGHICAPSDVHWSDRQPIVHRGKMHLSINTIQSPSSVLSMLLVGQIVVQ